MAVSAMYTFDATFFLARFVYLTGALKIQQRKMKNDSGRDRDEKGKMYFS